MILLVHTFSTEHQIVNLTDSCNVTFEETRSIFSQIQQIDHAFICQNAKGMPQLAQDSKINRMFDKNDTYGMKEEKYETEITPNKNSTYKEA